MYNVRRQGSIEVVTCHEPLVGEFNTQLMRVKTQLLDKGIRAWIIDLQHVPLIDSRGLEALLELRDLTIEQMGTMKVAGLNALCQEIFRITGMNSEFEIYPNTSLAAGSFSL